MNKCMSILTSVTLSAILVAFCVPYAFAANVSMTITDSASALVTDDQDLLGAISDLMPGGYAAGTLEVCNATDQTYEVMLSADWQGSQILADALVIEISAGDGVLWTGTMADLDLEAASLGTYGPGATATVSVVCKLPVDAGNECAMRGCDGDLQLTVYAAQEDVPASPVSGALPKTSDYLAVFGLLAAVFALGCLGLCLKRRFM